MCASNCVCTCSVCSSPCARLHSLMCTVCRASERTSGCLIDCVPGQDEFLKKVCPESSIWSIDVGRVRSRGREMEGRKMREGGRERQNEEAFSLAFLPLSLSAPMSKTDGAGALCVCVYGGKCRLM